MLFFIKKYAVSAQSKQPKTQTQHSIGICHYRYTNAS